MKNFNLINFFIILVLLARTMSGTSRYKVELVQVLFRHGARTYSKLEEKFGASSMTNYLDKSIITDYGYEQLTNLGKMQSFKFGQALRNRYNDFLGEGYTSEDLYAYTSDNDRTKMTLLLVLAGLFPPSAAQTWNPDLKWIPIPINFVPKKQDILLKVFGKDKFQKLLAEAQASPTLENDKKELLELSKFFEEKNIFSLKKLGYTGCTGLFNIAHVHRTAGVNLPDWFTDDIINKLKNNVIKFFDIISSTNEMKKIHIGGLIRKFIENMNLSNDKVDSKKIYLYSGHDLNISAFRKAHNIKEVFYPDYGSAIIVEKLRDSQNQIYIRIIYYNAQEDKLSVWKLGEYECCPVEEYLKIVKDIIPSDAELNSLLEDTEVSFDDIFNC